jgi:CDGSH-type Zn-finger protein/truncated hemoglobin YjbI
MDLTSIAARLGTVAVAEGWGKAAADVLSDVVSARLAAAAPDPGAQLNLGDPVEDVQERLWQLTIALARLAAGDAPADVMLAAAGSQDVSLRVLTDSQNSSWRDRLAMLDDILTRLEPRIVVVSNGPYVLAGPSGMTTYLGEQVTRMPLTTLCRCGSSEIKPSCDGACFRAGFRDGKDPNRVTDRRDKYAGQQVTVLDNRGICQHSGRCTDHLATVFHADSQPFVTPSGARMDEVIRAVRDCPSGALSFAMDGIEAREQADHGGRREPNVEVSKNGPYRITGSVALVDDTGAEVLRNVGASREHYALCRCGHSQNKPFCSGMHWYSNFRDPVRPAGAVPTIFEWAGGMPAMLRMTRHFYEKYVPADDLLAPLFASMSPDHPERVATWLAEVFGGPKIYSTDYGGYSRMLSQHRGQGLTEAQRARWVELLTQSAHDAGWPRDPEFQAAFNSYIQWGSRLALENSQVASHPPEHMPMPRWDWSTTAGPPGSRVSALASTTESESDNVDPILPATDEALSFRDHIKPLFRTVDRNSMLFALDLWKYDDVRTYSGAILDRLRQGSMPCDGAWADDRIDVFARWIDDGAPA